MSAVVALLATAPIAASPQVSVDLTTQGLLATGSNQLAGHLAAIASDDAGLQQWTPAPAFTLHAADLQTERVHTQLALSPYGTTQFEPTTTPEEHGQARMVDHESRREYDLFVAALDPSKPPELEYPVSACLQVEHAIEDEARRGAYVDTDRPDVVVNTEDAMYLVECAGSGQLTVRGDMVLVLWEIDVTLQSEDGEPEKMWSGRRAVDDDPIVNDTRTTAGEAQEFYVYARNATLDLSGIKTSDQVFAEDATLGAAGRMRLSAAKGIIGGVEIEDEDVEIDGAMEVQIARTGEGLAVRGDGSANQVSIDGTILSGMLPTPDVRRDSVGPWFALLVIPVLAAAWWYVRPLNAAWQNAKWNSNHPSFLPETRRERRAIGYWLLASGANRQDRHRASLRYAHRSLRLFPGLPDARFLKAVAMSHRGQYEDACQEFTDVYPDLRDGRPKARAACAASASCIKAGNVEEAKAWLLLALQEDVLFVAQRVQKPLYDAIGDEPWVQSLREGIDAVPTEDAAFA